jgi:RHS repeat-associated protein
MSGEVSLAGRVTYLWNPRDLQTGYCPPSGQIGTFTHRYDDLRASIDPGDGNPATKLVWDPRGSSGYTDLLTETKQDQSVPRQYWRGAQLVTFKEVGAKCVYACDHLGSMECLLDEAQGVAAAYQVSAWGEVLTETGVEQCFKFGGEWGAYCDALSRDLWMRARMMAPGLGRWLSRDPVAFADGRLMVDGLYRYSRNVPTALLDPTGHAATAPARHRCATDPKGPCAYAKSIGDDKGYAGGVVCCEGRKYVCEWLLPGHHEGVAICVLAHEASHLDEIICPATGYVRPDFAFGVNVVAEDCRSYELEIACLNIEQELACSRLRGAARRSCDRDFHNRKCFLCGVMRQKGCASRPSNCRCCP